MWTPDPQVIRQALDGRVVLLSADCRELITLNPVGSIVWDALPADLPTLTAAVRERVVTVDADVLERDVVAFLAELQELALVAHG